MYNDIFTIGPVTIHGYGLSIAVGVLAAVLLAAYRAKHKNLSADMVYSLTLICLLAGFVGAKLLYAIVEFKTVLQNPIEIISGSGFVIYGGIIGGIIAALIYCRIKKVSFLSYFDLLITSVALAQGFGRIGCFLAGCCYGIETDYPIGIVFKNSLLAPNNVRLMPTQLISSAGNFLICAILLLYARKDHRPGRVGFLYLILYGVGRFAVEFLRADFRGNVLGLSTSQFISIFMVIGGIAGMLRTRVKQPVF